MMKKSVSHWGIIAILGFIHIQGLLPASPWVTTELPAAILIMGVVYLIARKHPAPSPGYQLNGTIYFLQILLIVPCFAPETGYWNLPLLIGFIGLEWIRIRTSRVLSGLLNEKDGFEKERRHMNETFRIVRSERHDFLKHISAIHYMLDHREAEKAKEYLDELVDGYEETNLSIKGERGSIAGILHQMYRDASNAGLSIVYDTDLPLSTMPMTDKELVALLGNLLSNSIDAALEWQEETGEQGAVTLQFHKRSGLYILKVENHCRTIPGPILDKIYQQEGITTKSGDHHGLGTKMIKDIVKDYNGFLDFIHKGQRFETKLKFPAIH
ncbi:LytT family two-component system sensor histidine kinase NatK [Rossellomorea marisflavi]